MSSLVPKKQTLNDHEDGPTNESRIPCPPRLHRQRAAAKKSAAKVAAAAEVQKQPIEPDTGSQDCEMETETDHAGGEDQQEEEYNDQEKV
jgi:hypothetical protein